MIDKTGIDPNSIPKPANVQITKPEYTIEMNDYESGGLNSKKIAMTNEEQLKSYNRQLASAAVGMKEVASRTPWIRDDSKRVKDFAIDPGTTSMVQINGLTKEMQGYLSGTAFSQSSSSGDPTPNNPAQKLEEKPSELTVTKTP